MGARPAAGDQSHDRDKQKPRPGEELARLAKPAIAFPGSEKPAPSRAGSRL